MSDKPNQPSNCPHERAAWGSPPVPKQYPRMPDASPMAARSADLKARLNAAMLHETEGVSIPSDLRLRLVDFRALSKMNDEAGGMAEAVKLMAPMQAEMRKVVKSLVDSMDQVLESAKGDENFEAIAAEITGSRGALDAFLKATVSWE